MSWIAVGIACAAGFGCGRLALQSVTVREKLGNAFNRGHLLALVDGQGLYQVDLERQIAESSYAAEIEESKPSMAQRNAALNELVAQVAAESSAGTSAPQPELAGQWNLLRCQFADEKGWKMALRRSDLSSMSAAEIVKSNLKTRRWISTRIAPQLSVTEDECHQFYDSHRDQFFLPERRNVSHLFLAAPPETPPDVVETKGAAIETLSTRLAAGEDFATLAAENSEDEATKLQGGELGYFSAKRMPPDFVAATVKLHQSEISKPVRTRLGFHILKLIDVQASRQQTFDEVRGDIAIELANKKRVAAIEKLMVDLRRDAGYLRPF
jgi:parvulin-like peptidyl-prolyl isomerase